MRAILKHSTVVMACALYLLSGRASADVAPPDICDGEGSVCDNAGPSGKLPGVCTASKCSSPEPKPGGGVIIRDCLRCLPSTGGTGGSAGAGAAGAGAPATGGSDDEGGCDCRLSHTGTERAVAATMLLVGFVALWGRRRR